MNGVDKRIKEQVQGAREGKGMGGGRQTAMDNLRHGAHLKDYHISCYAFIIFCILDLFFFDMQHSPQLDPPSRSYRMANPAQWLQAMCIPSNCNV